MCERGWRNSNSDFLHAELQSKSDLHASTKERVFSQDEGDKGDETDRMLGELVPWTRFRGIVQKANFTRFGHAQVLPGFILFIPFILA
jgi:hypothetical protein